MTPHGHLLISVAEGRLNPNLRVSHFGGTGGHVIGPQIEGAAARKVEAGVVPVGSRYWRSVTRSLTAMTQGSDAERELICLDCTGRHECGERYAEEPDSLCDWELPPE
jgi:hypothetical protein